MLAETVPEAFIQRLLTLATVRHQKLLAVVDQG